MLKVLCVDDDVRHLELIAAMIRQDGHRVSAAGSGAEALKTLQEADEGAEPFDVVVTDYKMAPVDGLELCRDLKRRYPDLLVVLITQDYGVLDRIGGPTRPDAVVYKLGDVRSRIRDLFLQRRAETSDRGR